MENYNNIINNEYNDMVYGANLEQQQPMTSIPREMQITQDPSIHQNPVANQQPDIINLSYHQRDIQMPHPNLPEQMGLYPTVAISSQHNHVIQQQQQQQPHTLGIQSEEQQIPQNVSIQYTLENVSVNMNLDVQNNNDNFESNETKNNEIDENAGTSENTVSEVQQDGIANEASDIKLEDAADIKTEEDPKKNEPEVDPNQCRVCKSTESLIDIFAIEENMRICDIIMKMCSNIRIHERDFLPHMICLSCLGRLRTAYQFTKDVIATDQELRSKLKRSKKARKPTDGFIIVDCNEFSDSDDYDMQNDDDDYQVSNAEEDDDDISSGEESENSKKIRGPKKRGPRRSRGPRKQQKQEFSSNTTKRLKRDIVFIEANDSSDEKPKKKEKCKECNKSFSSKLSLRMHRKNMHQNKLEVVPFKCHICGKAFRYSINLTSHMQIHKDSYTCDECGRIFATKGEVKRHALNQHKCSLSYECNKCRRLYCSVKRYQKHRESCSDYSSSAAKRKPTKVKEDYSFSGRDLFKTVAPVTTTYWSDSFSD